MCFRYHSAGDGRTNTSIVAVDNAAEESFFSSFVRREITQTSRAFLVLSRRLGRIQRSVLSFARSRSLVLPTATTERGQFLDLLYAPRNAGGRGRAMGRPGEHADGRARTKRATNHRRKEEGRRIMTKEDLSLCLLRARPEKGVVPAAIATLGPLHIPPLLPPHPTPSASPPSTPLRSDIRQATHDSFTL